MFPFDDVMMLPMYYNPHKPYAATALLLVPDSSRQSVYVLFQNRSWQCSHPSQQAYGRMRQERHPSYINPIQLNHFEGFVQERLCVSNGVTSFLPLPIDLFTCGS